ncbi:nudix hydrolase 2-like [Tasmannia lanceolata]|uniref:nudix hydrolase 2-like n=1 Tax=Tasmannia lanceolata TaxID=3420 RepID=UPI0040640999
MSASASPLSTVAALSTDSREAVEILTAVNDRYGGITVDIREPMDAGAFVSSLRVSISKWRQQGKKGVWIKLPIEHANLVQAAVQEGFWYHHAEPNYLMLVYWIPDTVHTLPVNATHTVGVGGFVMNDRREVLVVQEKFGSLQGTGIWKFPTGVVDQGEDIFAGAIREVKEETGIDTEFVEVLAFRQSHNSFCGKSDLFFICVLHPLSFDIEKQESEIEAAQWMPIEEFASQSFLHKHEALKYMVDICVEKTGKGYDGFSAVPIKSGFSNDQGYLYLNNRDLSHRLSSGKEF